MSTKSSPAKTAKLDQAEEEACLKQDSIPITGVTRKLQFKVSDEKQAVAAELILRKIHAAFKADVPGFTGAQRFVCKEHWDVFYFARFKDLDSIVAYMGSEAKTNKIEPLIKEIEELIKSETKSQNFVADDWE